MLFLFIPITPSAHQQESHLARDIAHHLSDKLLLDFFYFSLWFHDDQLDLCTPL